MMQKIKQMILAVAIVAGVAVVSTPQPAAAINVLPKGCEGQTSEICKSATKDNATDMVKNILNILFMIIGILAVIMIVVGGFRYVLSAGDSSAVTAAKNTILYAVIGLIVALLAFAIVNFVITSVRP